MNTFYARVNSFIILFDQNTRHLDLIPFDSAAVCLEFREFVTDSDIIQQIIEMQWNSD